MFTIGIEHQFSIRVGNHHNGLMGTDKRAHTAALTGKGVHSVAFIDQNGTKAAVLPAQIAGNAYFGINLSPGQAIVIGSRRRRCPPRYDMQIRCIHIAISIRSSLGEFNKSAGNRGLACASFTAQNEQLFWTHAAPPGKRHPTGLGTEPCKPAPLEPLCGPGS